jgi:alanine-glyoxylate transaminase/serine-glyoxylate transaminase/serine-pyruvate transaminase
VSVTTIDVAPGVDIDAVRTVARERFAVSFAGALGAQRGKAFRIGHLGDLNAPMILGCLGAIEASMTVCRVPFGRDGVQRAVEVLAAEPERR